MKAVCAGSWEKSRGVVLGLRSVDEETRKELEQMNLLNQEPPKLGSNRYQFYVSDKAEKFMNFANSIIKYGILSAKTIHIEKILIRSAGSLPGQAA